MPYPLIYTIRVESHGRIVSFSEYRRKDAARVAFLNAVYEAFESDAALDTQRAHDAMRKAESMDISAPDLGYMKSWEVRIRDGIRVELNAIRQYRAAA